MQLEKLSLLEERLDGFIQQFIRLKEDKGLLERKLEEKCKRLDNLEGDFEELRQEREMIRERLGRILERIERLEALEAGQTGMHE